MSTRSNSADNPSSSASFVDQLSRMSTLALETQVYGLVITGKEGVDEEMINLAGSGFRPIDVHCNSRCTSCCSCASCVSRASRASRGSRDSVYSECPTPRNPYYTKIVLIVEFCVKYIKDPQRIQQFANVILDIMLIVKYDSNCITVLGDANNDFLLLSFQNICWENLDDGTLQQVFNKCKNHISLQECFRQGTRQDWWPIWANNY